MYFAFLQSATGAALVELAAVAIVLALLLWARAPGHRTRLLILGAAAILTIPISVFYVVALAAGWWTGEYFMLSPVLQGSALVAAALLAWTVWLAGYQWLADHSDQPVQIYVALSLIVVLGVAVAHRMNLGRGHILVGPDLTVVLIAIIGAMVFWLPVLLYDALRRNLERVEPIP